MLASVQSHVKYIILPLANLLLPREFRPLFRDQVDVVEVSTKEELAPFEGKLTQHEMDECRSARTIAPRITGSTYSLGRGQTASCIRPNGGKVVGGSPIPCARHNAGTKLLPRLCRPQAGGFL